MKAYVVLNYTIHDVEAYYQNYVSAVVPQLMAVNAKVLVGGHDHTTIEGEPAAATVVLEFPSRDVFDTWYNSDEYKAIIDHRLNVTEGWMVLADEFQLPQA